MPKYLKIGFLAFYILCAIEFFELNVGGQGVISYLRLSCILITAAVSLPYFFIKSKGFVLPVQMMSLAVLLSIAMAYLAWGQGLMPCLIATIPFMVWFLYFYVKHLQISVEMIERVMLGFGVLYVLLYFFQLMNPHTNYFGDGGWADSRGVAIRIIFPGRGIFYFVTFLALCKFSEKKENKLLWGGILLLGVLITVLQVTRQFIFAAAFIYLIHFLKNVKFIQKIAVLGLFLMSAVFVYQVDHPIVNALKEEQTKTIETGEENIRIQAAKFFLTEFSISPITQVLGNGVPYWSSRYGGFNEYLNMVKGYFFSDVGLVGIYAMFGVLGVLAYLLIWLRSLLVKLPTRYHYLKYYLWFIMITCLTSNTIYGPGDLVVLVLVVYAYDRVLAEERFYQKLLKKSRKEHPKQDLIILSN